MMADRVRVWLVFLFVRKGDQMPNLQECDDNFFARTKVPLLTFCYSELAEDDDNTAEWT